MISRLLRESRVLKSAPALLVMTALATFSLARLDAASTVTTSASTGNDETLSSEAQRENTIVANTTVGGDGTIQNDGWGPSGGLMLGSDNNFYGTTGGGGAMELGILFQLSL
jgi:uncharacterized repeat protein (TIGR03803 family)